MLPPGVRSRPAPASAAAGDSVDIGPGPGPDAAPLAWSALESAGLVSATVVSGPLGAVLGREQKQALRDVLGEVEAAGGKLFTGRPPRLTARKGEYVARQIEKNPSRFRASLWVDAPGKGPPEKLDSLEDLRVAHALVTGDGLGGLKNPRLAGALHRLDRAGWIFRKRPRNGADLKEVGPLEVYRSLEAGPLYDSMVVSREDGEKHLTLHVSTGDALAAIDFFFGSGEPAALDQPELGSALKRLSGLGFEPRPGRGARRWSSEGELLDAYFSARSGNPIELCVHGRSLATFTGGTPADLEAAGTARVAELERARRVMDPLVGLGVSYSSAQEDLFAELHEPVPGLDLEGRATVAAQLLRALPEKFPGSDERLSRASLVTDIYRDCRLLGLDGAGLREVAEAFSAALKSRGRSVYQRAAALCGRYRSNQAVRAALLAVSPSRADGPETPARRLDWLERLARASEQDGKVSDVSLDDLRQILRHKDASASEGIEAYASLLEALPREKGALSRETLQSAKIVLEPAGGLTLEQRVEAFRSLGLVSGTPFATDGVRPVVYGAFRARVETGETSREAAEQVFGLLERITRAAGEKGAELCRYVFTEAASEEARDAVLTLAGVAESPWEAVSFCKDHAPSPALARAAAPIFRHTGFSTEVAELLAAEPGCAEVLGRVAPLVKDGEVGAAMTRALGALPVAEQKQGLDFLERLEACTEPKLPARALQGALEAVAARRAPGQSFAEAAKPVFDLIPALSRRVELATVLWDRVSPAEHAQGLDFLQRASRAALEKLEDADLKRALEAVLDARTSSESLEEASLPLLRLIRLMAEEPVQAIETYRFLKQRPEELGPLVERFEHAYLKSWDAAAVRETMALAMSAEDRPAATIRQQGGSVLVGAVSLPVRGS
ncbi:MAG: hypothetical protein HY319_27645 [Armatimonadetes bacterium]|nr:hypothetical protein [Armatimonadota bacterium]